jgi:ATP-dependent protease ClpP protease subunit
LVLFVMVLLSSHVASAQDAGVPTLPATVIEVPAPAGLESLGDLMSIMRTMPVEPVLTCNPESPHCTFVHRLSGEVTVDSVNSTIRWLNAVGQTKAEFAMLEINSAGGSFEGGVELARAIEISHAKVVCVVDGQAASAAFYILQACDIRVMTKRSSLTTHDPFTMFVGAQRMTRQEALNEAEDLRVTTRRFTEHVLRRMKVTYKQYRARVSNGRDWHMDWEDAKRFGAVDVVSPLIANQVFGQLRTLGGVLQE